MNGQAHIGYNLFGLEKNEEREGRGVAPRFECSILFWEIGSISVFISFSSVVCENVDTIVVMTWEECEFLKQGIEGVMNCKPFLRELGLFLSITEE